jgi:hypothetical protein
MDPRVWHSYQVIDMENNSGTWFKRGTTCLENVKA